MGGAPLRRAPDRMGVVSAAWPSTDGVTMDLATTAHMTATSPHQHWHRSPTRCSLALFRCMKCAHEHVEWNDRGRVNEPSKCPSPACQV